MVFTESSTGRRATLLSPSGVALVRLLAGLRRTLAEWDRRRRFRSDLKRLLAVGPHMIADVGLTLDATRREIAKPLWRP